MDYSGGMDHWNGRRRLVRKEIRERHLCEDSRGVAVAIDAGALHHLLDSQEMLIVRNDIIPFDGFDAITIWPFVFVRYENFDEEDENHEGIHGRQQLEMLIVGIVLAVVLGISGCGWWSLFTLPIFFYWYLVEWAIRKVFCSGNAYRKTAFEAEAYDHQDDMDYLKNRPMFAWIKYL